MASDLPQRVYDHWRTVAVDDELAGIECDGAEEAALDALEARYGFQLPAGFRALYLLSDGTQAMDASEITFWPIDVIESQHAEATGNELCFADFRLGFCVFAVDLDQSPPDEAPVYAHANARTLVATSFSRFLEQYLEEPSLLVGSARP